MKTAEETRAIADNTLEEIADHIVTAAALEGKDHVVYYHDNFCMLTRMESIVKSYGYTTRIASGSSLEIRW